MSLFKSAFLLASAVLATAQPQSTSAAGPTERAPRVAASRIDAGGPQLIERSASGSRELERASDGLFYVDATVNGVSVRFLVDTGASTVVLTAQDARRAGISPAAYRSKTRADTANGGATMSWVTLDHVHVAGTSARRMRAVVAGEGLGVSLLGQSWLSQLGSVTIEGDRMTLR
jgi:aspartyl protease family protein